MKRLTGNGFTIVESLIVLAISGALLASVTVLISGQQGKAQFKSAMTDVTSKIQQTINEAATGYYPTGVPFSCQKGGILGYTLTAGATEQGANEDCIYIGRAMMFGVLPKGDPDTYLTHTIIGRKQNNTGKEVTSLLDARARAAVPGYLPDIRVDLSEEGGLLYGLKLRWMRQTGGGIADAPIAGVAFVLDPGNTSYSGSGSSQLNSSAQQVSIIPIFSSNDTGLDKRDGAFAILTTMDVFPVFGIQPGREARLCFQDGGDNQSGLVRIGSSGGSSAIDYTIYPNANCTP